MPFPYPPASAGIDQVLARRVASRVQREGVDVLACEDGGEGVALIVEPEGSFDAGGCFCDPEVAACGTRRVDKLGSPTKSCDRTIDSIHLCEPLTWGTVRILSENPAQTSPTEHEPR